MNPTTAPAGQAEHVGALYRAALDFAELPARLCRTPDITDAAMDSLDA